MSESSDLSVESSKHRYYIKILLEESQIQLPKNQIAIVDAAVLTHKAHLFEDNRIVSVKGNENSKQFSEVEKILISLADYGLRRGEKVSVIGGGCIQDISTIATSLFMRGIDWDYYPTTLASMMDSCIGGKSSINLGSRKNLVGNFHPPHSIIVNPAYISTLPNVEISAGIAEGAKICFAKGSSQVASFMSDIYSWRESQNVSNIVGSIKNSLECKRYFIEIDEFDRKERQLLNYGHSFGHALESSSKYSIPHGIGVLAGMLAAHMYAFGTIYENEFNKFLFNEFKESNFSENKVAIDLENLIQALSRDKKNSREFQILVLPNSDGSLQKVEIPLNRRNLEKSAEVAIEALERLGGKIEVF